MDIKDVFIQAWPTIIAGGLYLIQAGIALKSGQHGMSVTFSAYALANVGLIWAMLK